MDSQNDKMSTLNNDIHGVRTFMTTLGLIRHGITDWNLQRRAQGQIDIPLNEAGLSQAKLLAERLAGEQWDMVYSSDLLRAKQTAEMIATRLSIPHRTDERIREKSFGRLEGTTVDERIAQWGVDWASIDHGVETSEQIRSRGILFIEDIVKFHRQESVLVVSHGGWIGEMLHLLMNEHYKEHIQNTSISVFQTNGRGWTSRLLNCVKHLSSHSSI